jgi:hypothetical protein
VFDLPIRVDLPLRLAGAWLFGCSVAALSSPAFVVLGYFSVPLAAVAMAVTTVFAPSVLRHPAWWSAAAVAIGLLVGCAWFGKAGILSLLVSLPAVALFLISLFAWKPATRV